LSPESSDASLGEAALGVPATLAARPQRELTARALITGALLGSLLAAGNVYTGLKSAFIDGGSITAALVSFTAFATFGRLLGGRLSAYEVNVAQTTASSAAILSFVGGLMGPIPALALMGEMPSPWLIVAWTLSLGIMGSLLAWGLRDKLIGRENLPFPTGAATAEVIDAVVANDSGTWHRTRLLLVTAPLSAVVTWLRDGPLALLPQTLTPNIAIRGLSAATLNLGLGFSPLMVATGIFMGPHASSSLLAGGVVAWLLVGPHLVALGVVEGTYLGIVSWCLWPAIGLLISSTLLPLAFEVPALARTLRDLRSLVSGSVAKEQNQKEQGGGDGKGARARLMRFGLGAVGLATFGLIGTRAFGLAPWESILLLALTMIFSAVCGRSAGETDLAPIGSLGTLTQIFFARGAVRSIGGGSAVSGTASQVSQSLWAYKCAQRLGASPTASLYAQWLGLFVGALVVVPVYLVIVKAYGLATPALPAVPALTWRATAEALRSGFTGLPKGASWAMALGLVSGCVLTAVGRLNPKLGKRLPSPTAFALGLISPLSLATASFLGAMLLVTVRRFRPVSDGTAVAVASGGMVGESLAGVLLALWLSFR